MTDNEIIKALECCSTAQNCTPCKYEPTEYQKGTFGCCNELMKNAIDLIKRQRAEIEELSEVLSGSGINCAEIKAKAIKEFAQKLFQKFAGHNYYHGDVVLTIIICLAEGQEVKSAEPINICDIKTEAIVRFAERLKDSFTESQITGYESFCASAICDAIDEFCEEMTEGNNGDKKHK